MPISKRTEDTLIVWGKEDKSNQIDFKSMQDKASNSHCTCEDLWHSIIYLDLDVLIKSKIGRFQFKPHKKDKALHLYYRGVDPRTWYA